MFSCLPLNINLYFNRPRHDGYKHCHCLPQMSFWLKAAQKIKTAGNQAGVFGHPPFWQLAVISAWSCRRRPCSFAPRAFAPLCLLNNSILQLIRTFVKNYKNQLLLNILKGSYYSPLIQVCTLLKPYKSAFFAFLIAISYYKCCFIYHQH